MDLAEGHLAAVHAMASQAQPFEVFNLGTGQGYSVLEMIQAYEQTNACQVPFVMKSRRPGDVAACFAKVDKAAITLKWKATRSLADMCKA